MISVGTIRSWPSTANTFCPTCSWSIITSSPYGVRAVSFNEKHCGRPNDDRWRERSCSKQNDVTYWRMGTLHSSSHPYSHNTSVIVQSVQTTSHERTKGTNRLAVVGHLSYRARTSSPIQPRVFVFTHSMNRSAMVQKARIFPFVTWTNPTASIATQLRIVAGSAGIETRQRVIFGCSIKLPSTGQLAVDDDIPSYWRRRRTAQRRVRRW